MLRKLLKYDLRAIFKYWWVAALSSVAISFLGGGSLKLLLSLIQKTAVSRADTWLSIFSVLGLFIAVLAISAFIISSEIFIYVRFYKHLFSDEGYLTFTLPVKRRDILNSKILSGFIMNISTVAVVLIDASIVFLIGIDSETIGKVLDAALLFIGMTLEELGAVGAAYIAEAVLLLLCFSAASYHMFAFCITFAATVAKKYKVFAAIGIYYLVCGVISFFSQICMSFGVVALSGILSSLPDASIPGVLALMLFSLLTLAAAGTFLLYTIELYMLDKKLNLS